MQNGNKISIKKVPYYTFIRILKDLDLLELTLSCLKFNRFNIYMTLEKEKGAKIIITL